MQLTREEVNAMTEFFATAWLFSIPLLIYRSLNHRLSELFVPQSQFARAILYGIFTGNILTAFLVLLDVDVVLAGASILHWSGFFLLCFIWLRSLYLFLHPQLHANSN